MTAHQNDPHHREHLEPHEGSNTDKLLVPVLLLGLVMGFGVCYLWLNTPNLNVEHGDSGAYFTSQETSATEGAANGGAASPTASASLASEGKAVFERICQACHQANGEGLPGAFPPLAGSQWVTGEPDIPIAVVLKGLQGNIEVKGTTFNGVMASFGELLSDREIAAVVSYVRSSWGNAAGEVREADVKRIRAELKELSGPIEGQEQLEALAKSAP